jgi:hypothetical protein
MRRARGLQSFPRARISDMVIFCKLHVRLSEKLVNFCILESAVNWKDMPESRLEILAPTALSTGF